MFNWEVEMGYWIDIACHGHVFRILFEYTLCYHVNALVFVKFTL